MIRNQFSDGSVEDGFSMKVSDGSVDLKLGKLGDQRDFHKCTMLCLTDSSTPTKRVRAVGLSSQTAFSKVYGCNKDLSSSKDHHRRHKVCTAHSKTAKVVVNGIEQRFFQQCSRFHLLAEFDDGKRSCCERLAGHNERRRKPQVGIYSRRAGKVLQSCNGSRFPGTMLSDTSFLCQNIHPSRILYNGKNGTYDWCKSVKVEDGHLHSNFPFPLNDFEKQFPPFHDTTTQSIFNETSTRYPHDLGGSTSGSHSFFTETSMGSENLTVYDTVSTIQELSGISDACCALSLFCHLNHRTLHATHQDFHFLTLKLWQVPVPGISINNV